MPIEHILFDADGVLQRATTHWQPALQSVLGLADDAQAEALLRDVFDAETEVLESEDGFAERLDAVLHRWNRASLLSQALAVLHAIDVHDDILQTVQALRYSGVACHIASNQQASRAMHMSAGLNYRSLFDSEFYSCFIGSAKPKLRFFETAVARLGCDAGAVLFIDDRADNVEAARRAGLHAMLFTATEGAPALERRLAEFGVRVAPATVPLPTYIADCAGSLLSPWQTLEPWQLTARSADIVLALVNGASTADYAVADGIAIHKTATVEAGAILKSPLVVGARCFIAAGAYLRGGCWVADECVIGPGSELKSSFVFTGSKLAHFNFVGDSVLGSGVNLEAGSIICNHRNERQDKGILVRLDAGLHRTGTEKFGALVGDASRIGANAVLAPGALFAPGSIVPRTALCDQELP